MRAAVAASLDASLARLGMEPVDILHLHNVITSEGGGKSIAARQVLDDVVPALDTLRQAARSASWASRRSATRQPCIR